MNILLTNDDGYQSEGLRILSEALTRAGHQIWICAPASERSASSHSMTLRGEITITEYAPQRYHCSGTPADCILYASKGRIFPIQPDLVISGINHGYNISTDILYSGTVGAAREAALTGLHSMAVSCSRSKDGSFPFARAAAFVVDHLDEFYPMTSSECIININVPGEGNGKWKSGVLSYLEYHDAVETKQEQQTHYFDTSSVRFGTSVVLSLKGGIPPVQRCDTLDTDFQAVQQGYVSVTALSILPPVYAKVQKQLDALSQEACDG
ncbi:MAG: 5'/3'-nucleotidase SurE [Sphaerochaeta sp.]|jgi:5'-nucleotidase|uniref:5'/3'-nucleotidase SurE n=1 Tax=Sphaerochaeta sp. TaxID=1972642 RepID=UPI002FC9675B